MTRHPLTAAAVFVTLLLAPVSAADVTGTWTATFETEVGTQQYTYEFIVKGAELTGTAKSELLGDVTIEQGKVEGNTISFVENGNFQGMPLRIVYSGEMTSADEIAFTRNVADFATEKLVAKRVK